MSSSIITIHYRYIIFTVTVVHVLYDVQTKLNNLEDKITNKDV